MWCQHNIWHLFLFRKVTEGELGQFRHFQGSAVIPTKAKNTWASMSSLQLHESTRLSRKRMIIEWVKSPANFGYYASYQVHSVAWKFFSNILHGEWYEPHRKSSGRQSTKIVHVNQTRSSEATWLTIIRPYSSNEDVHSHLCPVELGKARGIGMDHLDDRKGWVSSSSSTRCIEFKYLQDSPVLLQLFPMSGPKEGYYRILEASSRNFVVLTADKDAENLTLKSGNELDGHMPDEFGREAGFHSRTVHSELW